MDSFLFVGPCTYLKKKSLIKTITNLKNAIKYDHLDVVKYLVSRGADITALNNYAIRYASGNGHLEVVKYLISQGADTAAVYGKSVKKERKRAEKFKRKMDILKILKR